MGYSRWIVDDVVRFDDGARLTVTRIARGLPTQFDDRSIMVGYQWD